jgi:hypothetical protein
MLTTIGQFDNNLILDLLCWLPLDSLIIIWFLICYVDYHWTSLGQPTQQIKNQIIIKLSNGSQHNKSRIKLLSNCPMVVNITNQESNFYFQIKLSFLCKKCSFTNFAKLTVIGQFELKLYFDYFIWADNLSIVMLTTIGQFDNNLILDKIVDHFSTVGYHCPIQTCV